MKRSSIFLSLFLVPLTLLIAETTNYSIQGFDLPSWDSSKQQVLSYFTRRPVSQTDNELIYLTIDMKEEYIITGGQYVINEKTDQAEYVTDKKLIELFEIEIHRFNFCNNKLKRIQISMLCFKENFLNTVYSTFTNYSQHYGSPNMFPDNSYFLFWPKGNVYLGSYIQLSADSVIPLHELLSNSNTNFLSNVPRTANFYYELSFYNSLIHENEILELENTISAEDITYDFFKTAGERVHSNAYFINDGVNKVHLYVNDPAGSIDVYVDPGRKVSIGEIGIESLFFIDEFNPDNSKKRFFTGLTGYQTYEMYDFYGGTVKNYLVRKACNFEAGYTGPVYRLSDFKYRDYLIELEIVATTQYNIAIEYFKDGRWVHECIKNTKTIFPDNQTIFLMVYDTINKRFCHSDITDDYVRVDSHFLKDCFDGINNIREYMKPSFVFIGGQKRRINVGSDGLSDVELY